VNSFAGEKAPAMNLAFANVGELAQGFHVGLTFLTYRRYYSNKIKGTFPPIKLQGVGIMLPNKSKWSLLLGTLLGFSIPNLAQASGFALIENSASGQGNAYAGAAAHATDGSTVWFNPAGMMKLDRDQLVFAGHIVSPNASFTNNGSVDGSGNQLLGIDDDGGSTAFVPNFYWVKTINDATKFGIGVTSPFGLATEYEFNQAAGPGSNFVGRYHGVLSDLKTVNINPSLAFRVNDRVSIGGGLNLMFGTVELSSAIDLGTFCDQIVPPPACANAGGGPQDADGFADLSGDNSDDLSIGFNLGITFEATQKTIIGLAYRSEVQMDVTGDADFTLSGNPTVDGVVGLTPLFVDTGISASVTLPASLSLSLSQQVGKFSLLADATWTGWSSFQELRVIYDNPAQPDTKYTYNWNDTYRFSVGFDFQQSDALIWRAGLAYDESPVPSAERRTVRLPGSDRTWLSLGLTYLFNPNMSFDVGYSHLFIDDGPINNTLETDTDELNATITGEYKASVDILSAQFNWYY
jgi:long-chain fatty acid transport protein